MIAYAARAVPWRLVLAGCLVTTALMAIVAVSPDTMWPLQGTAIGLLAGLAAWSMDETAAPLVDALPRPLAWRTAARALGIVPPRSEIDYTIAVGSCRHGVVDRAEHPRDIFQRRGLLAALAHWSRWLPLEIDDHEVVIGS